MPPTRGFVNTLVVLASMFAVSTLTISIGWAVDSYRRVSAWSPGMLDAIMRKRIERYESMRRKDDYVSRVFKTNFKNDQNVSETLEFLQEANKIIIDNEVHSVVNDWWVDASANSIVEVQFFGVDSVNTSYVFTGRFSNDYKFFEHFRVLNQFYPGFGRLFKFLGGGTNILMANNTKASQKFLGHVDYSNVSFATLLKAHTLLVLN